MGEYLSPGVYVEEKSGGIKPIEGVGTSTGAFVGIAEKGPIGEATLISNYAQFEKIFGNYLHDGYLAYAVNQFFKEDGTRCYVVRTCHYDDSGKKTAKYSEEILKSDAGNDLIKVSAFSEGKWGDKIIVEVPKPEKDEAEKKLFKLLVKYQEETGKYEDVKKEPTVVESFADLTIAEVEAEINKKSAYIFIDVLGKPGELKDIPKYDQRLPLKGGDDGIPNGDIKTLTKEDYIGKPSKHSGIYAFDMVNINIVAIPDMAGHDDVIMDGLAYCKNRKDCIFIVDPHPNMGINEIKEFRSKFNNSYGALYYPWPLVTNPLTHDPKYPVPPSGAAAGTISYVDTVRGVYKAAAGTPDGYLDSATGIEAVISKQEHDELNPEGINVIRSFPTQGICIWGARTLDRDPEWRYLNVRRLFIFIEQSIERATQWVVFEPNSPALWGSVIRNITAFLLRVWKDGALFGNTAEEAFYVKVDAENNPPEVRDAGQLIIEIGVAPVKPAEFVIVRISQKTLTK